MKNGLLIFDEVSALLHMIDLEETTVNSNMLVIDKKRIWLMVLERCGEKLIDLCYRREMKLIDIRNRRMNLAEASNWVVDWCSDVYGWPA